LKVHVNSGENVVIQLTADTKVRAVTLANIEDIKPGSYIGSAAMPQEDGTLKALEVHVFPPELAGSGDGHRPFDLAKGSSMTNGSVGDLVVSNGRVLTVNYKGGQQKILVPEDVPIVNLMPGIGLLKVGVKIVTFVTQGADGTLTAQSISAGKDGVTPPITAGAAAGCDLLILVFKIKVKDRSLRPTGFATKRRPVEVAFFISVTPY
jgi:hypothetical protein